MSIVFSEKIDKNIENGKQIRFWFYAHQEDFRNVDDEGCFTCEAKIYDENGMIESEFYRLFPIKSFKKQHYKKFVEKFCSDKEYRNQFNLENEKQKPTLKVIDEEIADIIKQLNTLGLKTIHSCQGTKSEFSDRPRATDGHSVTAYVMFSKKLPQEFLEIVKRYDLFLSHSNISIHVIKRKHNYLFKDLMLKIISEYKKQLKEKNEN